MRLDRENAPREEIAADFLAHIAGGLPLCTFGRLGWALVDVRNAVGTFPLRCLKLGSAVVRPRFREILPNATEQQAAYVSASWRVSSSTMMPCP